MTSIFPTWDSTFRTLDQVQDDDHSKQQSLFWGS